MLSTLNVLGSTLLKTSIPKIVFNELYKTFLELFYLFQKQRYVDFFCNSSRETPCIAGILRHSIAGSRLCPSRWDEEDCFCRGICRAVVTE